MSCVFYCAHALWSSSRVQKLYEKDRLKLLPFVPLRIKELRPLAVEKDTLLFNVVQCGTKFTTAYILVLKTSVKTIQFDHL